MPRGTAAEDSLEIQSVEGSADERAFWTLPYALYRGDPYWVPPLRGRERRRFHPRHNASLRPRWMARFLARRGGRVVGRIAAVRDDEFSRRFWAGAGFFGFYECADDAAATRLLAAAEDALRGQGLCHCLGPVNLSTHDEVGLLVSGFDSRPMLLSPYNPARYEEQLQVAGYSSCREYYAYRWLPEARPSPAMLRALRRRGRGGPAEGVVIRCVDPKAFASETRRLHLLYNACFEGLWGFVPMSAEEFAQRAEEFRSFYRPELALVAERDGEPVGFALALPDVNEALAGLGGRLWPFGWARLAWRLPRIRSARAILAGVRPDETGHGIGAALAHALAEAGRGLGLESGELSLVQSSNRPMRHLAEALGCSHVKTYRLYARALGEKSGSGRLEASEVPSREEVHGGGGGGEEKPVDGVEQAALPGQERA